MRKIVALLFAAFVLYGCGDVASNFSNKQQGEFDRMLTENHNKDLNLSNDIQKKEFNDSVKLAIGEYMDSVKLFVNWQGRIKGISSKDTGENSIALSFELIFSSAQIKEVSFDVVYVLPKDSADSDKIYQTVKNFGNLSTVYFDGFIRETATGEASYSSYDDYIMHAYPKFHFFVVDINATSKGDTLSPNLQKAVDLSFKAIEPLKLQFKKKISEAECDKQVKAVAEPFKAAKKALTKEEAAYVDRLSQALTLNFLYAE